MQLVRMGKYYADLLAKYNCIRHALFKATMPDTEVVPGAAEEVVGKASRGMVVAPR
jgi:hypothetical protein